MFISATYTTLPSIKEKVGHIGANQQKYLLEKTDRILLRIRKVQKLAGELGMLRGMFCIQGGSLFACFPHRK